jgi:hypothetical protein
LAYKRVFHINKEGFLPAFKDAFFDMFTEGNCCKAFEALGLVPLNMQVVLDCLEVRPCTPPQLQIVLMMKMMIEVNVFMLPRDSVGFGSGLC